jgi:glycine oxidase
LALKKAFVAIGDLREHTPVDEVLIRKGGATGIRIGDSEIRSGIVVLAAGAWSATISGVPEEIRPPVRPVKGQMISLTVPENGPLVSHLLHYDDKFIIQRHDGRLLIGATVEERGFDTTVTAGAMLELLTFAQKVLPNVSHLSIWETWAGVRPGSPDGVPILGPTDVKGLVLATGHFRNGILLGPITADVISEFVISGRLSELAEAFTLQRFDH